MTKTKDALIIVAAVLLALAVVLLAVIVILEKKKNDPRTDDTTVANVTTAAEVTDDTTAVPVETTAEPGTGTAAVTTEPPPVTTDPESTAEETTLPADTPTETTLPVTTAAPVTQPVIGEWKPEPVDGAVTVGYTSKGFLIQEKDGITYVAGLLIANKTYSLPSDYVPAGYPVPMVDKVEDRLLSEAQSAFGEMQKAFKAENPKASGFKIQSGYRSYATQTRLYNNYVKNKGAAAADIYSARPGHSEHQTGLAADINVVGTSTLYESIKNTTEGKWLAANSWKYGFILRYPEGKSDITGYVFEPWHFRYIGREAAKAVFDSGLCLEEFLGIDSVYPS